MVGGIQTQVTTQPVIGIPGDFCDANPRYSVDAGPFGLVAGPSGLTAGLFAWVSPSYLDADGAPAVANNFGGGPVAGFVRRDNQGLITTYLASSGLTIPAGFQVTVFSAGGFFVKNDGATTALPGMKAYAAFGTGKASFAAPGAPTTTTQTSATIVAGTGATFTGSIAGNVLTIVGAVTNTLYLGALLSGTGVATGTQIISQLTGATGAAGTYSVNIPQTVASTAMTATPYLAAGTGGSGIIVGSTITATSTGATGTVVGGVVTSIITPGTNVVVMMPYPGTGTNTTATLTFEQNVETSWYCRSYGLAGEVVKMSNLPGIG